MKLIDIDATFSPWWENGDPAYTFRLKTIVAGDFYKTTGKDRLITSIVRVVNESKAARSYLAHLEAYILDSKNADFFLGTAHGVSGHQEIDTYRLRELQQVFFTAQVFTADFSIDLGVDLSTMNELLLRFESRIFSRIDSQEKNFTQSINDLRTEINSKLDIITEMLKWKEID